MEPSQNPPQNSNPPNQIPPVPEGDLSHVQESDQEEVVVQKKSLIPQLFPSLSKINFSFKGSHFLLPAGVIALVLLIGGGGTYVVASSIFQPDVAKIASEQVTDADLPEFNSVNIPDPTATPTVEPTPAPTSVPVTPSPTPTTNPAANWTPYTFGAVSLSFTYPPGWYINVGNTSGPPFLYVQNYSPSDPVPTNPQGTYAIQISRFPQVGITTVDALTAQLTANAANNVYIGQINMGLVTVVSSNISTINGYAAYERVITYSNSPFSQVTEIYVLDGVSNVVKFTPLYDTVYGQSYLETLLSSISFGN